MLKNRAHYTSIGVTIVFVVVLFLFYGRLTDRSIHESLAAEQVEFFETFVLTHESRSNLHFEERINQIQNYYPSGTKQLHGTPLDSAVESARRIAIRCVELEQRLYERQLSHQDLAQED